jgi:hypothetical protein
MMSCGGHKALTKQNVYSQASARIVLTSGIAKEGMILKKSEKELIYVDSETHKKESIKLDDIRSISESDSYYDFNGDKIPVDEIEKNKGNSKMLSYGAGGLLLGAAVGTAVGVAINSSVDISPLIPMGLLGAGGAVWFGINGSKRDFEDAVYETQYKRYQAQEAQHKAKLKKQLEEEKKRLEESKLRKEQLLKESKK